MDGNSPFTVLHDCRLERLGLGPCVTPRKTKPQPRIIDARNRVALSPEAMKALDVETGDYVVVEVDGGEVKVRRVDWQVKRSK